MQASTGAGNACHHKQGRTLKNSHLADALFALYELLFHAPFSLHTKQRAFESAAIEVKPWQITHISLKALQHLTTERAAKGLRRGHSMKRVDRARAMFGCEQPMSRDTLLELFFVNDTVTLVTAVENATSGIGHWSELIAVPEGHFTTGSYSIYANKKDLQWADSAAQRFNGADTSSS